MKAGTLKAVRLQKSFDGRTVVDRLSIYLEGGRVVGLLGPNGAGKTTAFYMMAGLLRPDRGTIFADQKDITLLGLSGRARLGIAYLPQERSVFQGLSVEQNLLAVLEFQDISGQEQAERKDMLLEEFSLGHLTKNPAGTLSGGEARRLEIARALAIDPSFLLMDEPFAGIDPITVLSIQEIIKRLRDQGIGILISDHNVRETLEICDRAYILNRGRVLASGDPLSISQDPEVRNVYLGEDFRL